MDRKLMIGISIGIMAGTLILSMIFLYAGLGLFIFVGFLPFWLFRGSRRSRPMNPETGPGTQKDGKTDQIR